MIVAVFVFVFVSATSKSQTTQKPNIIYILADDLGYAELGCYGNTFNETPNLDRMASQGIRFTNFYAAAPVCSPYRAALMTGQYPARVGITDFLRPNSTIYLDTTHYTLAEMFRDNGYRTGIIGKWHLSGYKKNNAPVEYLPNMHGFQEVLISEKQGISMGPYWHPYQFDPSIQKKSATTYEFLTDRQNNEALEFIERNKEKPFFLYLSHYAVHAHHSGKPALVEHFRKKPGAGKSDPSIENAANDPYKNWPADYLATNNNPQLAAQLYSVDEGVGMILNKLKDLGLDKNTIVIFTSDNGGATRFTTNAPLRAGKGTLYEGGVKEPMIIYAPGFYQQKRTETARLVNYDIYPTMMDIINARQNRQKMDGTSFHNLLKNPSSKQPGRKLYWHYPLPTDRSVSSIIKGDWKLLEFINTKKIELYNITEDISEKNDLASKYPKIVNALYKDLVAWRIHVTTSK